MPPKAKEKNTPQMSEGFKIMMRSAWKLGDVDEIVEMNRIWFQHVNDVMKEEDED